MQQDLYFSHFREHVQQKLIYKNDLVFQIEQAEYLLEEEEQLLDEIH